MRALCDSDRRPTRWRFKPFVGLVRESDESTMMTWVSHARLMGHPWEAQGKQNRTMGDTLDSAL